MQDLCGIISIFIDASIKKYSDRGKEELPALLENFDRPTNQKHGVPPDMPSVVGPSKHTLTPPRESHRPDICLQNPISGGRISGGYPPDIRDVTDDICKLRKSYH